MEPAVTAARRFGTLVLHVPADPEWLSIARLNASAVADGLDLSDDQLQEFKLAVAEAMIVLLRRGPSSEQIEISFTASPSSIDVEMRLPGTTPAVTLDGEADDLSLYVIRSIVDEVHVSVHPDRTAVIHMHKVVVPQA
jgi:anti-sigma regulatory factor (Ser/Thr protein kinase)